MRILYRTLLCAVINTCSLLGFLLFIVIFSEESGKNFWKFGPSKDLIILNVSVDTWQKYMCILIVSSASKVLDVIVNDIGSPNLGFSIYNPITTIVYGFTKNQLQLLANWMWLINGLKNIADTLIIISRFDVAIISVLCSQVTSVFVIRYLLSKKKLFISDKDSPDSETDILIKEKMIND